MIYRLRIQYGMARALLLLCLKLFSGLEFLYARQIFVSRYFNRLRVSFSLQRSLLNIGGSQRETIFHAVLKYIFSFPHITETRQIAPLWQWVSLEDFISANIPYENC